MGQSTTMCCQNNRELATDFLLSKSSFPTANNTKDQMKSEGFSFNYFVSNDFVLVIKDKSLETVPKILLEIINEIHPWNLIGMIGKAFDCVILYKGKGNKREMEIKKQFAYAIRAVLIDVKELISRKDMKDTLVVNELQSCLMLNIEVMMLVREIVKERSWDDVIRIIYELTERLILIRKILKKVDLFYYNHNEKLNYEYNLSLAKTFYGDIVMNVMNNNKK